MVPWNLASMTYESSYLYVGMMTATFSDDVIDPMKWTPEEISTLWSEMDRLRMKAKDEGWEEEFLSNVREWAEADGTFPVRWLKLRRKDWIL